MQPGGTMQDWALTLDRIVEGAANRHGARAIVTRHPDGSVSRATYAGLRDAARRVSAALRAAGVGPGDRIATLAWNSFDHLALWYGAMGIGAVCHTINPRLHEDQLAYIANHGGAVMLFADDILAPLAARLAARTPAIRRIVHINAPPAAAEAAAPGALAAFLAEAGPAPDSGWGGFGEETVAGLCYTSGTTGDPKGVAYTHRSNYLLALNTSLPDGFALSAREVVMPLVPMFHANSWGLAFSAPLVGAKLVMPGPRLDGASLHDLIEAEGVTFAAAVPTVWQGYVDHLRAIGVTRPGLRRAVVGGSACPAALLDALDALGITPIHAWGMTELSPVGLVAAPTPEVLALPAAARRAQALKQGRPIGIDMRVVDDAETPLPHDGVAAGRLQVRGPTVLRRYYGQAEPAVTPDGWFDTGDIATIDRFDYVRITDRAKDIVKSGGEWISSVDIENALLDHPNVALAAVIAIPHEKWGERPKLYIQLRTPGPDSPESFRAFLEGRIARWWLPDAVEILPAIPLGATGKIDKKALRDHHATSESPPP